MKQIIFLFFPVFVAFQFPVKVLLESKVGSVIPILVFGAFILFQTQGLAVIKWRKSISRLPLFIYLILVFQLIFLLVIDQYPFMEVIKIFIVLSFSVACYYVPNAISKKMIISFYRGLIFASLIILGFFLIDHYLIRHMGYVIDYHYSVTEYSRMTNIDPGNMNLSRIAPFYRSQGLLDHTPVGMFFVIFIFLMSSIIVLKEPKRSSVIPFVFIYVILLYIQSYTAIAAFSMALFFLILVFFEHRQSKITINILAFFTSIFLVVIVYILNIQPKLFSFLEYQLEIIFGYSYDDGDSFFDLYVTNIYDIFETLGGSQYFVFFFGDGLSHVFGYRMKGGDYGHVENLFSFGVIIYSALIFLVFKKLRIGLNLSRLFIQKDTYDLIIILLPYVLLVYLLFAEFHYSIWLNKAILPVMCILFRFSSEVMHYEFPTIDKKAA